MKTIGITGIIGSGKSTVAGFLRELGAEIIEDDRIGHQVYEPGTAGWDKLVAAFGKEILDANGQIDRHRLGQMVFADSAAFTFKPTQLINVATRKAQAHDGAKIIFANSFGYGEAMKELAAENPDVKFEHATGAGTLDNFATYYGAAEDTIYLTGLAAGAAIPEGGTVGFVAPFPIPEVIRHINAFQIGVAEVNPTATTKVVWTNTWFDPAVERQAADSLIADGVDAIASGQDSHAPGEACLLYTSDAADELLCVDLGGRRIIKKKKKEKKKKRKQKREKNITTQHTR